MRKSKQAAKLLFPTLVVVAVSALVWYSGVSLMWIVAVVVGLLLNGFVATYEDDIPGGFNNPDGSSTPTYIKTVGAVAKIGCAVVCGTVGVVILVTALRGAMDWVSGTLFALTSASLGVAVIFPRRAGQWLAFLFALVLFAFAVWRGPSASNTALITVQAESLKHARELLNGNPVFEAGGTVEIRELPRT